MSLVFRDHNHLALNYKYKWRIGSTPSFSGGFRGRGRGRGQRGRGMWEDRGRGGRGGGFGAFGDWDQDNRAKGDETEGFGEWNPEANKSEQEPRETKREERRRERKSRWGDSEEVTENVNNQGLDAKDAPSTPPGDDLSNVNMDQDNDGPTNENFEGVPVDQGHNDHVPEQNNFSQVSNINDHHEVPSFDGVVE